MRRRSRSRAEMRLQNKGGASPHTLFVRARNPPACHSPTLINDSIRSIVQPAPAVALALAFRFAPFEPRPPDAHHCTRSPRIRSAHGRALPGHRSCAGFAGVAATRLRGKLPHQSLNTHTAHPHPNHTPLPKNKDPLPQKAPHPLSSNSTFKNKKRSVKNFPFGADLRLRTFGQEWSVASALFCPSERPGGASRASRLRRLLRPDYRSTPSAFRRPAPTVTVPALLLLSSPPCPPSGALRLIPVEGEGHRTEGRAQCKQNNNSRRSVT